MADILFSTDLFVKLSDYIEIRDIYSLGGTCRTYRKSIRQNRQLWKTIVCKRYPSDLWIKIVTLDEFMGVAINGQENLASELHKQYVLYRLGLPMSSKEALRVYIEIITPTLLAPYDKTILVGSLIVTDDSSKKQKRVPRSYRISDLARGDENTPAKIRSEKRAVYNIIFKRADGKSFYVWRDHKRGHNSTHRYYTIDRSNPAGGDGSKGNFYACVTGLTKSVTISGKDDKELISTILKSYIPSETTRIDEFRNRREDLIGNGLATASTQNLFTMRERMAEPDLDVYTDWLIGVNFDMWFSQLVPLESPK